GQYGLQATIVCNDQRLIRHFNCFLPGSQHDSTAYKDLPLHLNPDAYFSPTQYLLADSAYCNTMSVVTPFKQDQGYTTQKSGFNREVSHTRVTVEHTIGVLQTRL
ncbi:hypothetical protein SAICODRAFT_40377, partial [Saitoella complicata NRRL Y-17804]|uniref:uncharacterized protein n=1 Tax=Saitoella complicata (strain BCRC 22490 / CBS 7301 / JCM 7358 / NBRC 10748 / NRRL Y-17804) TaxID=698492 RepID=UPI0008680EFF